ncbi:hypothetical protein IAR55_002487 [Kwoniella newhampshirensis]|uniref:Elongin-A n=1 Tax=Kwoniella newhampshirensis TaxID=1651941 RepID=A0AAW0Z159_9TREE
MPDNPSRLEYAEEDDLFGSETKKNAITPLPLLNQSVPIHASKSILTAGSISSSSRAPLYPAITTSGRSAHRDAESRLVELRQMRMVRDGEERVERGVRSLKSICMTVIKANSARIWDTGDLEYSLIKPFIDDLPMEQLVEIEANSPHIKKETDWLFEAYLLQDHPLFHERCRERQGEPRTTGWRRMYRKAKEDAVERQLHAADRVAARYKQLEEEKAAKRIVYMDKIMPDKKPAKGGSGWGRSRSGAGSSSASSASGPKPASAIAKARVEAQRARVALTHASGRYIPPPPPTKRPGESELFKNPYLPASATSSSSQTSPWSSVVANHAPRIPPPRTTLRQTPRTSTSGNRGSSPSSPTSPIPGSFPTHKAPQKRVALPHHLSDRASLLTSEERKEEGRFRIEGDGRPKKQFKEIRKPEVTNFEAPKLPKEKIPATVDFFGSPTTAKSSAAESNPSTKMNEKRKLVPEEESRQTKRMAVEVESPSKLLSTRPTPTGHSSGSPQSNAISSMGTTSRPTPISADDTAKLNNIMFRKKKPIKGR